VLGLVPGVVDGAVVVVAVADALASGEVDELVELVEFEVDAVCA
jgi:hypothetical protein